MDPKRLAMARRLVEGCRSRADLKRQGAWLDAQEAGLRRAVVELARLRGVDLPDAAVAWPGKRLLRLARGREGIARVRSRPIRRDEGFTCLACGREVPPGGRRVRDHCPACLVGRHVDRVPGDRAAGCGGRLDPVGLELVGGHPVIHHRCRVCGARVRVRAHPDDDPVLLARLSARGVRPVGG